MTNLERVLKSRDIYLPRKAKSSQVCQVNAMFFSSNHVSMGEGNGTLLHFSCWKIPWMEEPGWLESMGSRGVGHD